jgi:hypothetical protein
MFVIEKKVGQRANYHSLDFFSFFWGKDNLSRKTTVFIYFSHVKM